MAISLEDRVRELEAFRFRMLGRINACQTLAIGAWAHIALNSDDPVARTREAIDAWQRGAERVHHLPGTDPVHLDAISQEYQEAIADLSAELLEHVQAEATRMGLPRKP